MLAANIGIRSPLVPSKTLIGIFFTILVSKSLNILYTTNATLGFSSFCCDVIALIQLSDSWKEAASQVGSRIFLSLSLSLFTFILLCFRRQPAFRHQYWPTANISSHLCGKMSPYRALDVLKIRAIRCFGFIFQLGMFKNQIVPVSSSNACVTYDRYCV